MQIPKRHYFLKVNLNTSIGGGDGGMGGGSSYIFRDSQRDVANVEEEEGGEIPIYCGNV
jgi:hypothetical protein